MTKLDHACAWEQYGREQAAIRRRELYEQADVSGTDTLDFIIHSIAAGTDFTPEAARRSRLTSARRERARHSLRARAAPVMEAELVYRSGPDAATAALLSAAVRRFPEQASQVLVLDAQGYTDHEVGARIGLSAAAVRQRISRLRRKFVD